MSLCSCSCERNRSDQTPSRDRSAPRERSRPHPRTRAQNLPRSDNERVRTITPLAPLRSRKRLRPVRHRPTDNALLGATETKSSDNITFGCRCVLRGTTKTSRGTDHVLTARERHSALIEAMVADGTLTDPGLIEASREVPRHSFIPDTGASTARGTTLDAAGNPERWLAAVYADNAIITRVDEGGVPRQRGDE